MGDIVLSFQAFTPNEMQILLKWVVHRVLPAIDISEGVS